MTKTIKLLWGSAALVALAVPAAALSQAAPAAPAAVTADPPPMVFGGWGVNMADLDRSVDPGDDFDAFVNGKWKAATEIPAKYPYYGVVTDLRLGSERAVKAIIDDLASKQHTAGTPEQRIADMYRAYVDMDSINRAGLAPAKPYLETINAVSSYDELATLFAKMGYPSPIAQSVGPDRGDPANNTLYVSFGGIGLPDRDNYLVDNERNREMRTKYIEYMTFLLGKAGHAAPQAAANSVFNLETKLASAMWDRAIARNPLLTTNRMNHAELLSTSNGFALDRYLQTLGITPSDRFTVTTVPPTEEEIKAANLTPAQVAKLGGGFPAMTKLITQTPLDVWKAWMTVRLLSGNADILPSEIDDANFAFYGKFLQGRQQQRDRWQRGVSAVEGSVGEAVGKYYVERHFPPESKAAMEELVGNLRLAMTENLKDLPWMTPATRAAAKTKLDQLKVKIGYASKFETYDGMTI